LKRRVAVTGGKGGTGKSTVAVNLAVALASEKRLVLADLDVEAPNDHILLGAELDNEKPIEIMLPFIDYKKCTGCGVCARVCDTGAIIVTREGMPFVLPRLCSGCRACYYACPEDAILEGRRIIGYTYSTPISIDSDTGFKLVTGVLREGEEHTPPAVLAARERAENEEGDLLLVDTSAGTGSSVAVALEKAELAIAVTEPTPLGLHDLSLILELLDTMGIEAWIVINRAGIWGEESIVEEARKWGARIAARIPYSRLMVESYVSGRPIVMYRRSSPEALVFRRLAGEILEVVGKRSS
jgi:MinD superfamily P-loop ATPase